MTPLADPDATALAVGGLLVSAAGVLAGLAMRGSLRRGAHRMPDERDADAPWFGWLPPGLAIAYAVVAAAPGVRGQPPATLAYLAAVTALARLVAVDVDVRRLPNAMTLPAVPVSAATLGVLSLASRDPPALLRALAGGATLACFYGVLFAVGRGHGLGLGDVKLAASMGQWLAWLGWTPLLAGAYLGLLFGGLTALVLLLTGLARSDTPLPHAPAMALGAICALWLAAPTGG